MIKRIISIMLVITIVFSINCYSAVVSDNDGSAFVTKAEFDAMKTNFNDQIENYENSITSKIDGAIASYLAGINTLKTENRTKLISSATKWTMYNTADYPKYVEGYPYLSGFSATCGNCAYGGTSYPFTGTGYGVWMGLTINGKSALATDGGFKKHIITSPSYNDTRNGTTSSGGHKYVAEWSGYYTKEGENITFAYLFNAGTGAGWAADPEKDLRFQTTNRAKNSAVPFVTGDVYLVYEATGIGFSTGGKFQISSASRKKGEIDGDTFVSTYQTISDDRFWNSEVSNLVGITDTTPAITYSYTRANFTTWFNNCLDNITYQLSCQRHTYDSTLAKYKETYYGSYNYSFGTSGTVDSTSYKFLPTTMYNYRLANDPNGLEFNRLWSAKTNNLALVLNSRMNDSGTTTEEKEAIKKALIFDSSDVAHLSMGAGYPLIKVSEDEQVSFKFSFDDTGDYLVFAKYSPFDPTADPATTADVKFDSGTDTTYTKGYKISAGNSGTLRFTAEKDGYVFLKWTKLNGTNLTGSATMNVSNNPVVVTSTTS